MGKIETERLILREFCHADATDVFAYASNPNVLRYTTGQTHQTIADAEKFIHNLLSNSPGGLAWAICLKDDPRVIGAVEFGFRNEKTGGIHFALAEEQWNKGLMTEAVRTILKWVFETHPELETVTTSVMIANTASIRVMEKCGMEFQTHKQEKFEKFETPVELAVYSISKGKWESDQNGRIAASTRANGS